MSTAKFFKVRNWKEFQHYKDRCPPWIKLYNDLLEDYEFSLLEDHQKFQLIAIFLLATRTGNKIPNDAKWVQKKIDSTNPVDLELFFEYRFIEPVTDAVQEPEQGATHTDKQSVQDAEHDASTTKASRSGDCIQSKGEIYRDRESIGEDAEAQQRPQQEPPDTEFKMHIGWRESEGFPTLMKMAGIPLEVLSNAARTEFITHWHSQDKTRHNQRKWDNVFLKSLTTRYRTNPDAAMGKQGGTRNAQTTAADRFQENIREFEERTDDPNCDYTPNF